MISETIYSNGKNNFKNDTFSSREWSAPTMVSPKEIRERIDGFALCGRKIKQLRMIGHSYFHTREWIEEAAYRQLAHLPEEERQRKSNYQEIDGGLKLSRYAEIDEPLLIEFEDGDVFEIDTPQEPEFRMNMNSIPWWIDAGTNQPNADANKVFSPCIGQEIVSIEIETYLSDKDPMFGCEYEEAPFQRELVSYIAFRLGNGNALRIGASIDYCDVMCVNENNECLDMDFSELKDALFNWEDLHNDECTGFEAESPMLFFGHKGACHADSPYITLSSSGNDESALHISATDFLVVDWCISLFIVSWFDEYGEYHFSYAEWNGILDEADRLLSAKNFDILFDELIERQGKGNYMICKLNSFGTEFWKNRAKYKTQINDLKSWSQLVLSENDAMDIYGF